MYNTIAAPQEHQENLEALAEGKEIDKDSALLLQTDDHTNVNVNDVTSSKDMVLTIENNPNISYQREYYEQIQSLNKE